MSDPQPNPSWLSQNCVYLIAVIRALSGLGLTVVAVIVVCMMFKGSKEDSFVGVESKRGSMAVETPVSNTTTNELAGPGPALRSPQLEETSYTGRVVNNAFRWLTLVGIVSICAWGAVRLAGDD